MNKVFIRLRRNIDTQFIECTKNLRSIFNLGLKEAKDYTDALRSGHCICIMTYQNHDSITIDLDRTGMFFHSFDAELLNCTLKRSHSIYLERHINGNSKIKAIKSLRYALNNGLKEAKDMMDEMWGYDSSPVDRWLEVDLTDFQVVTLKLEGFLVKSNVSFEFSKEESELFKF